MPTPITISNNKIKINEGETLLATMDQSTSITCSYLNVSFHLYSGQTQ